MKSGLNDMVLQNIHRLHKMTVDKISDVSKGQKPFASEEINPESLIYWKNTLGANDMSQLVSEYGPNRVNKLLYDISLMEDKRVKSGTMPPPPSLASMIPDISMRRV